MTRAEASRINGAKSRGPVTEEGKARSSQNNYRHGVYARRTVVLRSENREEYEESKAAHVEIFKPRDTFEAEAVIDIVNARWKLRRIETQATHFQDCRRLIKEPEFRKNFIYLSPAMSETLAYHANCSTNIHTMMMLDRAENTCRRTISRSLSDILKARKIVGDPAEPPIEEIQQATAFPVDPMPIPDEPKPEPPEDPGSQDPGSEPTPEPEKRSYEPEKTSPEGESKPKTGPILMTFLLALYLWAAQQRPIHPLPTLPDVATSPIAPSAHGHRLPRLFGRPCQQIEL